MKHLGGVLLALALLGGAAWGLRRWLAPPTVAAVYLEPEPLEEWTGISAEDRQGLIALLQETLELDARLTVLPEPPVEDPGRVCRIWKLSAQRRGELLHLKLRDQLGTVTEAEGRPEPTLLHVFRALGFGTDQLPGFLPEDPLAFWNLVHLCGPYTFAQLQPRKAEAVALAMTAA